MVLLTAAAVTLVGYGAYQGGKAAVEDTKKRIRRNKTMREHRKKREEERLAWVHRQKNRQVALSAMSLEDRLARLKTTLKPREEKGLFGQKK